MVPWKYGFKSIKSVVRISRADRQRRHHAARTPRPRDTAFMPNVNPRVDHPRWSGASERRIGGGFFAPRIDTVKFNGYGEYVAQMYAGQDLAVDY